MLAVRLALAEVVTDGKITEPVGTINAPTKAAMRTRTVIRRPLKEAFRSPSDLAANIGSLLSKNGMR